MKESAHPQDSYTLRWPEQFDEIEWLIESKGYFEGLEIRISGQILRPTFYDPVRLSQDIASALANERAFTLPFLIVVPDLSVKSMKETVARLAKSGELSRLVT
jgi:hypothetical protein